MALKEFHLPDIGEGIAEGEIVRWLVKEGDQVREEQEFVEVMTDKATVMITVPYSGVIKELRAKEGQVVPVESVIAVIDVGATAGGGGGKAAPQGEERAAKEPPQQQAPRPAAPKEASRSETRGEPTKVVPAARPAAPAAPAGRTGGAAPAGSPTPTETPASVAPSPRGTAQQQAPASAPSQRAPSSREAAPQEAEAEFEQASPGKVLAAPATRRRARELGIDLGGVRGTGPGGRVTNEDLAQAAGGERQERDGDADGAPATREAARQKPAERAPVAVAPPPAGAREERIPFRGLRRKIADAMSRSKHTAAHFTYVDDIDVTDLVKLRKQAKELYAQHGVNVTYLPFVMKAVVEAMKQFPAMNSSLDETTQELVVKRYYNFGIATDTDNGLIVPVVKDVDQKSIAQLARDIQELAERTRQGKIGVEDLKGGTFTITNAGNIGGLFATPVINFPEVAILGVHAIKRTPVVRGDEIVIGDKMYLSVSIDHRLVDGATGARWMNVVKECLEVPQRLLLGSL